MTIQTLHPAPAQTASERYYPAPEVQNNAVNAVTGANEAPGITAVQGKTADAGENGIQGELMDRFAPEEPAVRAGLYRKAKDQNGNPTLRFDDPQKAAKEAEETGEPTPAEKAAEEEKAEQEKKAAEKKETEKAETRTTTINTDRVDREIKELREKIEDVAQELRTATGKQAEKLEQELLLDKIELRIKDNDTYRRAHSSVSVG